MINKPPMMRTMTTPAAMTKKRAPPERASKTTSLRASEFSSASTPLLRDVLVKAEKLGGNLDQLTDAERHVVISSRAGMIDDQALEIIRAQAKSTLCGWTGLAIDRDDLEERGQSASATHRTWLPVINKAVRGQIDAREGRRVNMKGINDAKKARLAPRDSEMLAAAKELKAKGFTYADAVSRLHVRYKLSKKQVKRIVTGGAFDKW